MRRYLALAAFALAAAVPMSPAAAAPDCDIAQNCPCLIVAFVVEKATGYQLTCV